MSSNPSEASSEEQELLDSAAKEESLEFVEQDVDSDE